MSRIAVTFKNGEIKERGMLPLPTHADLIACKSSHANGVLTQNSCDKKQSSWHNVYRMQITANLCGGNTNKSKQKFRNEVFLLIPFVC